MLRNGKLELSFILLTLLFLFIQAFCNQTSLHGWQYITQRPETDGFWAGDREQSSHTNLITLSGFKHVFWSIIVCVAMGCAAIFLYSNTIDFMNATVVTTVDTMTVPLSEVFFPSVVVCNINQVSGTFKKRNKIGL